MGLMLPRSDGSGYDACHANPHPRRTLRPRLDRTNSQNRSRIRPVGPGLRQAVHSIYEISVPPRGWWAKKPAGKGVRQTALPPLNDPYRQKIRLAEKARETAADASKAEVHPLVAFEQDPVNWISVPATGDLTNTLVVLGNRDQTHRRTRRVGRRVATQTVLQAWCAER